MIKSNAVVYQHVWGKGMLNWTEEGMKLFKLVNNGSSLFYEVGQCSVCNSGPPRKKSPKETKRRPKISEKGYQKETTISQMGTTDRLYIAIH